MIGKIRKLFDDRRGGSLVEFAFAAPAIVALLISIGELGTLFFANAGLKSAVAEGARLATIFPRPTEQTIKDRIAASRFGLDATRLSTPTYIVRKVGTRDLVDIEMTYTVPVTFVFFNIGQVTLAERRRVYIHEL